MEEELNTSPTPEAVQVNNLTFAEAMSALALGKAIGKADWDSQVPGHSARLMDGRVRLQKPDKKFYDWILTDGDLAGVDYYIINERN